MAKSITLQRMTQGELPQRPSFREEALFLDSDGKLKTLSGTTGSVEDVEGSGGGASSEVDWSGRNVIYVSKGSAATDTRTGLSKYDSTRPFASLTAAQAAAVSGDLIVVGPGTYDESGLAKTGVNWHFVAGASIASTSIADAAVFGDSGGPMVFQVTGRGTFSRTRSPSSGAASGVFFFANAASSVSIEADTITIGADDSDNEQPQSAIYAGAADVWVRAREVSAVGAYDSTPIWWDGAAGRCHIEAERIFRDQESNAAIYSSASGTPTGELFIHAQEIISLQSAAIQSLSQNSAAAVWIVAEKITGPSTACVGWESGKLYITTQKITGAITLAGGVSYIDSQKFATSAGSNQVIISAGDNRLRLGHIDDQGAAFSTLISGGTTELRNTDLIRTSNGGSGLSQSGGTLRLHNVRINTAAVTSSNPITKSGGTLILNGVTLVAEASRDSIAAPTAQDIFVYQAVANTAKSDNATIKIGTLTVSADVE